MKISSVYIMQACENLSVTHENKSNSKSQVTAPNLCRNEPSPKKSVTSIFTSNLFNAHTDWHTKNLSKGQDRSKNCNATPVFLYKSPFSLFLFRAEAQRGTYLFIAGSFMNAR